MKFVKMQGLGNDYIYIDAINQKIENREELARKISDIHFGIGSDGMILICKSEIADYKMEIYNADGSQAEMCGNGIRCFGKFLYENNFTKKKEIKVETLCGIKTLYLNVKENKVNSVTVDMGNPILEANKIPTTIEKDIIRNYPLIINNKEFKINCVSMGNPHTIIFTNDLEKMDIRRYGKEIEKNSYFPNRTNVEFAQILNRNTVKIYVWERGTGETLACGTGACATVVAGVINGYLERRVKVFLKGGNLLVEWGKNNKIYLTGPATTVFDGELYEEAIR